MAAAPAAGTAAATTGENKKERAAIPCLSEARSALFLILPSPLRLSNEGESKNITRTNISRNYLKAMKKNE